jgi:hypothetical protein
VTGTIPPEVWNRIGMKMIPKLRTGSDLKISLDFSVSVSADTASSLTNELRQNLQEFGLGQTVSVE